MSGARKWKDKTRDGTPVRIYATDGGNGYPIHGAVQTKSGDWITMEWRRGGQTPIEGRDLVPVEPERIVIEDARFEDFPPGMLGRHTKHFRNCHVMCAVSAAKISGKRGRLIFEVESDDS